jgi:adenine phosphoribosyltransferase
MRLSVSYARSRLLSADDLKARVAVVPDFPKPGISFKDVTPIFADAVALGSAIALLREQITQATEPVDVVIGAEARGFVLGAALAHELGAGFIPTRKPGKLPRETHSVEYGLEYGTDSLQMHRDAIAPGQRVLVHDDLIATGGTAAATARMAEELGGEIVAYSFLVELTALEGRRQLPGAAPVLSLIQFDD